MVSQRMVKRWRSINLLFMLMLFQKFLACITISASLRIIFGAFLWSTRFGRTNRMNPTSSRCRDIRSWINQVKTILCVHCDSDGTANSAHRWWTNGWCSTQARQFQLILSLRMINWRRRQYLHRKLGKRRTCFLDNLLNESLIQLIPGLPHFTLRAAPFDSFEKERWTIYEVLNLILALKDSLQPAGSFEGNK